MFPGDLNFSQKAMAAIAGAQQVAASKRHKQINTCHLLHGILDVNDEVLNYALATKRVNDQALKEGLPNLFQKLPQKRKRFSNAFTSLSQTILRAKSISERTTDSLIEVHHLFTLLKNNVV